MSIAARPFDIVVFGATGFSGQLLAEYLVKHYISGAKIALGGRSQQKLEKVREALALSEPLAAKIPILIGDSSNLEQLTAIAQQTRCVASTVGPYAKYGAPLVEACARSGTSYCDLTGEPNWHATMFNKFESVAKSTGARIVHQAGFDSVPSDIGSLFAAQNFTERFGREPEQIQMFVSVRGGGVQGGTIDTVLEEFRNGASVKRAMIASKEGAPEVPALGKTRLQFAKGVSWNGAAKKWCIPFFMAVANMPYVKRSNGRLNYSKNLTYSEHMMFSSFFTALMVYLAMVVFGTLLFIPPTRWLLAKFVLPAPGQGPSKESCEKASYKMLFVATGGGDRADVNLNAVGDASCISTTCCLGETAMALGKEHGKLKSSGGVMTAASAMGNLLLERLRASGMFKIEAQPE